MFKNNFKSESKGFTLLELLIVIAIIGLITTVVLSSLSTSRDKAYESQIMQQLAAFRSGAELYFYSEDPDGYTPATSDCNSGIFINIDNNKGRPGLAIDLANLPADVQRVCSATSRAYAVKITSYNTNGYWCADSKGALKLITGPIGNPVIVCP